MQREEEPMRPSQWMNATNERQTGRTTRLLCVAIGRAIAGDAVLYVTHDTTMADEAFTMARRMTAELGEVPARCTKRLLRFGKGELRICIAAVEHEERERYGVVYHDNAIADIAAGRTTPRLDALA
jgi:predicted ThiF/HesA family dinucleotide-utilizing enzyme